VRLDARKGDTYWTVYHAEECRVLKDVVWVDDETHQWGTYGQISATDTFLSLIDGRLPTITHQARKIEICTGPRVVIINPIEDATPDSVVAAVGTPITTKEPA
jgi:hypothetical protein